MSRWLSKFLQETDQDGSDKLDIIDKEFYLSGLSGASKGLFSKDLKNMSEGPV